MSEAVVKPATSMMLLLPEMIAKSNAFAEKWKCGAWMVSSNMSSGKWRTNLAWRRCQRLTANSWRGSLVKTTFAEKRVVLKQKPGCVTITVMGNIPDFGPMWPNCRNWCPATILGMTFWVWFDLWRFPWETVSSPALYWKLLCLHSCFFSINCNLSHQGNNINLDCMLDCG